ncbi:hypothetical protein [Deinococcus hopiensis]|uniref:hypothetical protein n=1 Tax=Deinococcus hopiensis TaxID=309885 RepID=UPI00111C7C14|nr:hypothetical protein [Deinococcus hopiensis]
MTASVQEAPSGPWGLPPGHISRLGSTRWVAAFDRAANFGLRAFRLPLRSDVRLPPGWVGLRTTGNMA